MIEVKTFLRLANLDEELFVVDPIIIETDDYIEIFAELAVSETRTCPHCGSNDVVIKDRRIITYPFSIFKVVDKPVFLKIKKAKFKCKHCNKQFTQQTDKVNPYAKVPNDLCWIVFNETKEIVSFEQIAKKLNLSRNTVISIFDQIVTAGRGALSTAIAIDEKRFTTFDGKYITVISNAVNGKIIDVLPSRKKAYLFDHFDNLRQVELDTVKFFTSDMYKPFKEVHDKFFPKSLHIIDNFHITRLFTDKIQSFRIEYMKSLPKGSREYNFLKTHWKLFLINPHSSKYDAVVEKLRYTRYGEVKTYKYDMNLVFNKCPKLLEIYDLYVDFTLYMVHGEEREKLEERLSFIINKAYSSTEFIINQLGDTLLEFYDEIVNSYSNENVLEITNAIAESNNNKISKLIAISNGCQNFPRFRKRLLHLNKNEGI